MFTIQRIFNFISSNWCAIKHVIQKKERERERYKNSVPKNHHEWRGEERNLLLDCPYISHRMQQLCAEEACQRNTWNLQPLASGCPPCAWYTGGHATSGATSSTWLGRLLQTNGNRRGDTLCGLHVCYLLDMSIFSPYPPPPPPTPSLRSSASLFRASSYLVVSH